MMRSHVVLLLSTVVIISSGVVCRPTIKPTIQVLRPTGFRVSVPDAEGMERLIFHASVNIPMVSKESESIFAEVTRPEKHQWVFEDRQTRLRKGDMLYFKLDVIVNRQEYSWMGEFAIPDLLVTTTERLPTDPSVFPIDQPTVTQMIPEQPYTVPSVVLPPKDTVSKKPYSTTETPSDDIKTSLRLATSIYNTVENLTVEIKRLREINSILVELVEQNKTLSKSLTLSGTLPPYDDDIYIAQVIIKEKLGLHNLPVVSAVRNSDGSISFDMASLNDKIQVIKSARHMLRDSKIKLVY